MTVVMEYHFMRATMNSRVLSDSVFLFLSDNCFANDSRQVASQWFQYLQFKLREVLPLQATQTFNCVLNIDLPSKVVIAEIFRTRERRNQ